MMKRRTPQRDAIQHVILEKDRALDADEILCTAQQVINSLNQSTVYRNLFQLMVMLYIAVGMPLVHPLFHTHAEHDCTISAGGSLFQNPTDEGKAHRCPICDFDAINQLHAAACNAAFAGNQFIDDLVSTGSSSWVKASPQCVTARAPPFLPSSRLYL